MYLTSFDCFSPWFLMSSPRALSDAESSHAARLLVDAYPHRAHEPQLWKSTADPNETKRWVLGGDEPLARPSAYIALWPVQGTKFRFDLVVDPGHRRRGLGTHLLDWVVEQAQTLGATSLQARSYATETGALSMLERRGFRETMRMTGLVLDDIGAVRLDPLERLERALESRGVRITTLARELARDADAWDKLRDANQAAYAGWPDPDPSPDGATPPPESPDEFRRRSEQFGMIHDACFIAVAANHYLGYAALTAVDRANGKAGSGGTGVRPEHRGGGVATALKACCIRWAQDNGYRRLATSSGNPAMIRVNEKFGFMRTYDEVRLVLRW